MPESGLLLADSFKQNNCHRRSQIQATRAVHRNSDAFVRVVREQCARETFRFTAKDEEITISKLHAVIRTLCLSAQEKMPVPGQFRCLQGLERIPQFN